MPDAYYEYLWCKQGPEYSDESLANPSPTGMRLWIVQQPPLRQPQAIDPKAGKPKIMTAFGFTLEQQGRGGSGWAAFAATEAGAAFDVRFGA